MKRKVIHGGAKGIVVFESVLWLMTVMPLVLIGCVEAMAAYNRNVLRVIPEVILHEQEIPGLRLEGGVSGVGWVMNNDALFEGLSMMLDTAIERAYATTLQTSAISAKGCVSVFVVEESSGRIVNESERRCAARGPRSERLGVDLALGAYHGQILGIPLHGAAATSQFISRLVVVGLSVGAEMPNVGGFMGERHIEYGATAVPRQEVVL